jgi:hypothetical protein
LELSACLLTATEQSSPHDVLVEYARGVCSKSPPAGTTTGVTAKAAPVRLRTTAAATETVRIKRLVEAVQISRRRMFIGFLS